MTTTAFASDPIEGARQIGPGAPESAVAASLRRCRIERIDPQLARPAYRGEPRAECGVVVLPVIEALVAQRRPALEAHGSALVLTDRDGVIAAIWAAEATSVWLASLGYKRGNTLAEEVAGTNSVTTLVTGEPIQVVGTEHHSAGLRGLCTSGAMLVHPVTRRPIGSLNLVSSDQLASPFALSWAVELAERAQRVLIETATEEERLLMSRFLQENRDSRHAIVALNDRTIITNAAAARLVGVDEQAVLWERSAQLVRSPGADRSAAIEIGRGMTLDVHCSPIADGTRTVGVLLRLSRRAKVCSAENRVSGGATVLANLAGSGTRWEALGRRLAAVGNAPLLLVGDRGTGKSVIARELARGTVVDVDLRTLDAASVAAALRSAASSDADTVLIRHLDETESSAIPSARALLGAMPKGKRLIATSFLPPAMSADADVLFEVFTAIVPVPNLRDRLEDLPELVRHITASHSGGRFAAEEWRWMTDAMQALSRTEWPENIRSLEMLVDVALSGARTPYIGVGDLPAHIVAGATRRPLVGLERMEANAILQALHDVDGNKAKAADALGIARSTLYRKLRTLGTDLKAATY